MDFCTLKYMCVHVHANVLTHMLTCLKIKINVKNRIKKIRKGKKGMKRGKDENGRERGRWEEHSKIVLDRGNEPGRDIVEMKTIIFYNLNYVPTKENYLEITNRRYKCHLAINTKSFLFCLILLYINHARDWFDCSHFTHACNILASLLPLSFSIVTLPCISLSLLSPTRIPCLSFLYLFLNMIFI